MDGKEQRKEPRVPADQLPGEYRRFSILLGHGLETPVETTDASLSGFGFVSALPIRNFVLGSRLVLFPLGDSHPVYGVVRFAIELGSGTRVGVALQDIGGYGQYQAAIRPFMPENTA